MKKLLLALPLIFLTSVVSSQTEPTTIKYIHGYDLPITYTGAGSTSITGSVAVNGYALAVHKWDVTPGNKTITSFDAQISLDGATVSNGYGLCVLKEDSGIWVPVVQHQLTTGAGTGSTRRVQHYGLSVPVTLTAGSTYWYGIYFNVLATHGANQPLVAGTSPTSFNANSRHTWFLESNGVMPSTFSLTAAGYVKVVDGNTTYPSMGSVNAIQITYDSDNFIEYESSSYHNGQSSSTFLVPIASGTNTFMKFENCYAVDAASISVIFLGSPAIITGLTPKATFYMDFGGTDAMIFNANSVTLPNFDGYTQATSTFDVGIIYQTGNTAANVVWLNKTKGQGPNSTSAQEYKDIATISHKAASSSAYGGTYSLTPGYALSLNKDTRGIQIGKIQVGVRPLILMGDSQTGTKGSTTTLASVNKLGLNLPSSFSKPRIYWLAAISGGTVYRDYTGINSSLGRRFKSTPGTGDLCEIRGGVFCFSGIGVNDTSAPATTVAKNVAVSNVLSAISSMTAVIQSNSDELYFIGLPPYTGGSALAQQAQLDINNGLAGLAMAAGVPYANPFYYALPYTDGSLHYSSAGAALISPIIARTLENDKAYRVESLVSQTKRYNFNGSAEGQSYRFLP